MAKVTPQQLRQFQKTIKDYYTKHGRSLEWREHITEYRVVVSEIMLQQTQVERVAQKFPQFLALFPDWKSLASARVEDVLRAWQGLGYNRRALNLQRLAAIINARGGALPRSREELEELPGIGPNTAGSITAFAFNLPAVFIETNIRSVFIHFFFAKSRTPIHDKKLLPLIEATIDHTNPREWYYALMDYGTMLKRSGTIKNPSRKSAHHTKQSSFKGSRREIRAAIIKELLTVTKLTLPDIIKIITQKFPNHTHTREQTIASILEDLIAEGFIHYSTLRGKTYFIIATNNI